MKIFSPSAALAVSAVVAYGMVASEAQTTTPECTLPSANVQTAEVEPGTASAPTLSTSPIVRPTTSACPDGQISFLRTLTVIPTPGTTATTIDKLGVVFYAGSSTAPLTVNPATDCNIKYTGVGKAVPRAGDITFKFSCKDTTKCKLSYVAEWDCTPVFFTNNLDKTFKRKTAVGDDCTKEDDSCVDRCFKSVQVKASADGKTATVKSAFTPTGCTSCPTLSATVQSDGNTATETTNLEVSYASTTLTVDEKGAAKKCKSTYEVGTLTNPIAPNTYTRGTVTPPTCVKTDCAYKCAAELVVTNPSLDYVQGVPAPVPSCDCNYLTGIVALDGSKAVGVNSTTTYTWTKDGTGVKIVTEAGSNECTAAYTVKSNTGTGSGSGTKSAASGISVNTIWAVAATAVVAAAGAFVMA